jgi:hypothetical protein
MKDKHAWMWLGGIAVAAVFFWITMKNKSQTVAIPYLVPQAYPGAASNPNQPADANTHNANPPATPNPPSDSSSEQPNITGDGSGANQTNSLAEQSNIIGVH